MNAPWILMASGTAVPLLDPRPEHILLEDIGHHLSRLNRFTGGTLGRPYTVAQHSVLTAMTLGPTNERGGLFHDAHEAYLNDQSTPFLQAVEILGGGEAIRILKRRFDEVIAARFGFDVNELYAPAVKNADRRMLATERRDLLNPGGPAWESLLDVAPYSARIIPISHDAARIQFMDAALGLGIY